MGLIRTFFVGCCAAFAAGTAGFAFAGDRVLPADRLAQVGSRYLDEVFVRPGVDFAVYRRILVDPARVEFHGNWIRNEVTERSAPQRLSSEDARAIAQDFSASLGRGLAEAFKANGFELAASPAPGVLRLTPAIADLYVNAPERSVPGPSVMVVRDAGDAVLILEARDAATGALLARIRHHGTASGMNRFARSSDVSTRFRFDGLFSRWASDCARELARAGRRTTLSRLEESRSAGDALQ